MTDEETILDLRNLSIEAESPIVRAMSKFASILLEEMQNMTASEHDWHETKVNFVRLCAAVTELETIPPDIWSQWMAPDRSQAEVIAGFHQQLEIIRQSDSLGRLLE